MLSLWVCFYGHLGLGDDSYPAHVERAILLYAKGSQAFMVVELCKRLGANSNELTKGWANWLQRNKDKMDEAYRIQLEYESKQGLTAEESNRMLIELEGNIRADMWVQMKNDKDFWLQNCQEIPRVLRAGQLDL